MTDIMPSMLAQAFNYQRAENLDSEAVGRLFRVLERMRPTMTEIKQVICEFYDIQPWQLISQDRSAFLVLARQIFCFFSHKYARASLQQIKTRVGYSDHTTVHYSIHRIEQLSQTRPLIRDDLDLLRLRICEKLLARGDK